jgi:hypothetical protein
MSTSDDLSTALDALSISPICSPPSAESTFTLICSDGERISVDSKLLSASSSVFRDMLEVGSGEGECEVSESKEEMRLLLNVQQGQSIPTDASEKYWDALRCFSDKYEVTVVQMKVLAWAQCVFSRLLVFVRADLPFDLPGTRLVTAQPSHTPLPFC